MKCAPAISVLTPRQVAILRLVASSKTRKEIGAELGISRAAVDYHLCGSIRFKGIKQRLGHNDIAYLTRYAVREGLVNVYDV